MKRESAPLIITWLLILLPPLILFASALRPGTVLLPANLPFLIDPLWQPLAPADGLDHVNPILSDQFYQDHAWKVALRQMLSQGELPWWNPAINSGQPFHANGQAGLFDPFNLIGLLFPLTTSYVVGALLRLWVAAGFTYLYARQIGLSRPAAWLALLAFTLSGPIISWLGSTPSHVLVWLPALLWVGEKLLTQNSLRWGLTASVLLAILFLSSQPEIALQVALFWVFYLLLRATWLEGGILNALRRHLVRWSLIALMGGALAAVILLPFADALRHSIVFNQRALSNPFNLIEWLRHTLASWQEWPTLVTTLLPRFLGSEADESYWYPTGNSIENNAYAGILPLLLALFALWMAWRDNTVGDARRWIWLWGGLGGCAIALAVGLPLFQAINELFPFRLMAPGRLRALYVFAVAILGGFGLDFLLAQFSARRTLLILLATAALANILLVIVAYWGFTRYAGQLIASGRAYMEANAGSPILDQPLEALYALVERRQAAKLAMLLPTNPIMYLPLLIAIAVALIFWLVKKRVLPFATIAPALILITAIDLLWVSAGINSAHPSAWLEILPKSIAYLQQQPGTFRLVATQSLLNPNMSVITNLEDVRGYDPIVTTRYRELLAGFDGFTPSGYHTFFRHVDDPRLDLFNATYALSRTPPADPRWEPLFSDAGNVTLYHSRTALPRAYLVYATEVMTGPDQSLARTLDPAFDPRQSVVLEQAPAGWTAPLETPEVAPPVEIGQYRANSVQLQVTTPITAMLVLLDSYAPGWHATVDHQSTPIYPANHTFRAIVVPAGRHSVAFSYAPTSLTLGIAISEGACLLLLAALFWMRYSKHRSGQKQWEQPQ